MCSQNLVRNLPQVNHGPYNSIRDFVIASFEKELAYHSLYPDKNTLADEDPEEPGLWERYTKGLMEQLTKHRYSSDGVFHLTHGDLVEGNNVTIRGGKVTGIIDWETAAFLPFGTALEDLLPGIESILTKGEIQKFMRPNDLQKIERLVISHYSRKSHG